MLLRARVEENLEPHTTPHRPVLPEETLGLMRPRSCAVIVDLTLGTGGHAESLLAEMQPEGRLYGIDRDPAALEYARERLRPFGERFVALRGDHRDMLALLRQEGLFAVDGILADLGVSSFQLDDAARGFSFREDGPLDMRMDPDRGPSAADLVATSSEAELREVLWKYGEERLARPIARAIVRERERRPIRTTLELARIVERVAGPSARRYRIHPATRTFQALRIATNGEIEGLEKLVTDAVSILRRSGRLVVISFHSLEDRAVKRAFKALCERCICPPGLPVCGCGRENLVRLLTPKPIRPSREETAANPRSRSARLRAAERL